MNTIHYCNRWGFSCILIQMKTPFHFCRRLTKYIHLFCLCLVLSCLGLSLSLSFDYMLSFLLGWKTLICQKNCEGMEVGVWDGNFWPFIWSWSYETTKIISSLYEALHISIKAPYWKTKYCRKQKRRKQIYSGIQCTVINYLVSWVAIKKYICLGFSWYRQQTLNLVYLGFPYLWRFNREWTSLFSEK